MDELLVFWCHGIAKVGSVFWGVGIPKGTRYLIIKEQGLKTMIIMAFGLLGPHS